MNYRLLSRMEGQSFRCHYYWLIYLFIFGCAGSLLPCGLFSSCGKQELRFTVVAPPVAEHGFQGVQAYRFSSCGSWAREHTLSSCGTGAQMLCSMWDLPRTGSQRASPALAGGVITTEPPGKPSLIYFEITTQVSDFFQFLSY